MDTQSVCFYRPADITENTIASFERAIEQVIMNVCVC